MKTESDPKLRAVPLHQGSGTSAMTRPVLPLCGLSHRQNSNHSCRVVWESAQVQSRVSRPASVLVLVAGGLKVGARGLLRLQLPGLGSDCLGAGWGAAVVFRVFSAVAHGMELVADVRDGLEEGLILGNREGDALFGYCQ